MRAYTYLLIAGCSDKGRTPTPCPIFDLYQYANYPYRYGNWLFRYVYPNLYRYAYDVYRYAYRAFYRYRASWLVFCRAFPSHGRHSSLVRFCRTPGFWRIPSCLTGKRYKNLFKDFANPFKDRAFKDLTDWSSDFTGPFPDSTNAFQDFTISFKAFKSSLKALENPLRAFANSFKAFKNRESKTEFQEPQNSSGRPKNSSGEFKDSSSEFKDSSSEFKNLSEQFKNSFGEAQHKDRFSGGSENQEFKAPPNKQPLKGNPERQRSQDSRETQQFKDKPEIQQSGATGAQNAAAGNRTASRCEVLRTYVLDFTGEDAAPCAASADLLCEECGPVCSLCARHCADSSHQLDELGLRCDAVVKERIQQYPYKVSSDSLKGCPYQVLDETRQAGRL